MRSNVHLTRISNNSYRCRLSHIYMLKEQRQYVLNAEIEKRKYNMEMMDDVASHQPVLTKKEKKKQAVYAA